ncbi:putative Adenylate cyclase [Prochlorococcus marinus str. MIT 9302]|uniref:Putative Adenylate cyclase n=1 Tax=Prochlorococcus marinus str. MIT 9302 TaxID=74545 RepID=A0A0A2AD69_PROMR|nr:hypothetical protein [Prochlorococcus marinus]KGF98444.1 putative Adenylate cyclase [Prochlorococcus marinus str. MIT 9302]
MNNFNNCVEIDQINSQLERAELQKNRLICNLYREYELYLNLVRDLLYISVEKGLNGLCSSHLIKDDILNTKELFEKKISKLIYTKLPLITVEQLKINKSEKNINKEIDFNSLGRPSKTKAENTEQFQYENGSQFKETMQFQISEDISNNSEYYQAKNREKLVSLDLDKNDNINYLSNNHIFENIGLDKKFISSLMELIEEVKLEKPRHSDNQNINQIDIFSKNKNLKNFELIDKSLENLLLNLSYQINQELFNANLINKLISKDSFEYLIGNKLMIKHPHPFVINLEFNINQKLSKRDNLTSIIFFNISTVELEFKNLNLSIQRNKINELKIQFQRLIKKETYWRQKEITLNKIR